MSKPKPNEDTFDDLLGRTETEPAEIAVRLREIILEIHPETVEVIYLGYNSASYGIGPKKNSEAYCYIMPQKDRVNLGFYFGVQLTDPGSLLEGTGKNLRHVKVHSLKEAVKPAVRQLIKSSLHERQVALSP